MPTSQLLVTIPPAVDGGLRYSMFVALEDSEIRAAQRLRYQVFVEDMRARLPSRESGLDVDDFDAFCDHLVVRDDHTGQIVGTYRMLPPDRARRAGRLYCEAEFALAGLAGLRDQLVEAGRSCVHPEHRSGAVIGLVWTGIGRYLLLTGYRWLVGCASVPLRTPGVPDGSLAAGVWNLVRARHLAPEPYRVRPRLPWDGRSVACPWGIAPPPRTMVPPLLRGYLRLGAWVCGPPAHDPAFGVADFLTLLCLDRVDARYRRHFLGSDGSEGADGSDGSEGSEGSEGSD